MMTPLLKVARYLLAFCAFLLLSFSVRPVATPSASDNHRATGGTTAGTSIGTSAAIIDPNHPYKVLTTGNQVTVKCLRAIRTIMAWNTGGTRILEKSPHTSVFSFRVATTHKIIFLRIQLEDGKTYSEKIGLN